jgi:flagella basal body P-ring formation protein FlgA
MFTLNKLIFKIVIFFAKIIVLGIPACSFPLILFYVTHIRAETVVKEKHHHTEQQIETVKIPVLKNALQKGDIVSASDLTSIDMAQDNVSDAFVQDKLQILGMEAKRSLYKGKPILVRDFGTPTIIRRNDEVSMVYKNGLMELTTTGRALSNGGVGDIIKVINNQSKKIVSGKVTDNGEVDVTL